MVRYSYVGAVGHTRPLPKHFHLVLPMANIVTYESITDSRIQAAFLTNSIVLVKLVITR